MSKKEDKSQSIARQIKISPLLSKILSDSLKQAQLLNHEFFTPEHVLIVAIQNNIIKDLLVTFGTNTQNLFKDLAQYISTKIPLANEEKTSIEQIKTPIESAGFQAVMNRAVFYCITANSDTLDILDLLVGMLEEKNNYCSYYLKSNGMDKSLLHKHILKTRDINADPDKKNDSNSAKEQIPPELMSNNSGGLERFAVNITECARKGLYDTLIGRQEELERTIQVLCRRSKNNPLHIGDAGVGKTAITYGLAQRIVEGKVPDLLKGYSIYGLDLGLLLSGAKFRGDFEERLTSILDELKKKKNIILFIDEIHMILGAGTNGNSQMDAANLLKPILATGQLKFIGSTTHEEYTKNFEKDSALARRFQKIDIKEPTRDECIKILKGLQSKFEDFHKVKYTNSALESAVDLSLLYMSDKRLPDKAIDIIDECGSFLKISRAGGFNGHPPINKEFLKENSLTNQIKKDSKIPNVTISTVKAVTSKITKIPIDLIGKDEKEELKNIQTSMEKEIFGQERAIELLSKAVKKSRAGFRDPDKPEACYLFVGPTGCGKTELARVLSKILGKPLLRYDMSEYQERHSVSRLVGSPPGYVGFEEGGLLTKEVRKNPNAVILFDEIEKAHEDIYNILLQVMDYGILTDNQGRKADFKSSIIIMTSNAGARDMEKPGIGFGSQIDDNLQATLKEAVSKEFSPEFRNRLSSIVPFNYLDMDVAKLVCQKEIDKLSQRLLKQKIHLTASPECINYLTEEGYSKEFGARNMARIIEENISNPLVDEVLFGKLVKGGKVKAHYKEKIIFSFNED